MTLKEKIEQAINSASAENGSNTPDFILADYLVACLKAFENATVERDRWYGRGEKTAEFELTANESPKTK